MATNNVINKASPDITAHSLMLSQGASPQTGLLLTTGQVPVGVTGSDPVGQVLTALFWADVSGTTQAAVVNTGYIISNAGATTVTIPATAAEGSVFAVQGKGAGGWILQMNTGQTCHFGSSATTSAGSLASTNQWDAVEIVCITANTTFGVRNAVGNLTVA